MRGAAMQEYSQRVLAHSHTHTPIDINTYRTTVAVSALRSFIHVLGLPNPVLHTLRLSR